MTSKTNYDPGYISSFFDDYADCEWERLGRDAASRINFLVHRHHLRQWVNSGDDVLDAGAGPGRFTIELARIGATVTVVDISPAQLELNRQKVGETGCESSVTGPSRRGHSRPEAVSRRRIRRNSLLRRRSQLRHGSSR